MSDTILPDSDVIHKWFELIYGRAVRGQVEVAYSVKGAWFAFRSDDWADAAEAVHGWNHTHGWNIYARPALVATLPEANTTDADFLETWVVWADFDEPGAAEAAERKATELGCAPSLVVTTGRRPEWRAQFFWFLEDPITDGEEVRRVNRAIAETLDGDRSVVNPTRYMRVAGSIAWPKDKPGRVVEVTELTSDGRVYLLDEVMRSLTSPSEPQGAPETDDFLAGLQVGADVQGLFLAALRGENWHNNVRDGIAALVNRGVPDFVLQLMAPALTLDGYRVEDTTRDLLKMARGSRDKWNLPDPELRVEEPDAGWSPRPLGRFNPAKIPPRQFIFGDLLLRGNVTLVGADAGVGKSTLTLGVAAAYVSGLEWCGFKGPVRPGKVMVHSAEDDEDEIRRRLAAVASHYALDLDLVADFLEVSYGHDGHLTMAKINRGTLEPVRCPDVDRAVEWIKEHGVDVWIVDPLVETHSTNENDANNMRFVMGLFREVAQRADCAVVVVHHSRKPGTDPDTSQHALRGSSAIQGVARVIATLTRMSPKQAEDHGVPADERARYVHLEGVKNNQSPTGYGKWLRLESVEIGNGPMGTGDSVGVLVDADLGEAVEAAADADHSGLAVGLIRRCVARGGRSYMRPLFDDLRNAGLSVPSHQAQGGVTDRLFGDGRSVFEVDGVEWSAWVERTRRGKQTQRTLVVEPVE